MWGLQLLFDVGLTSFLEILIPLMVLSFAYYNLFAALGITQKIFSIEDEVIKKDIRKSLQEAGLLDNLNEHNEEHQEEEEPKWEELRIHNERSNASQSTWHKVPYGERDDYDMYHMYVSYLGRLSVVIRWPSFIITLGAGMTLLLAERFPILIAIYFAVLLVVGIPVIAAHLHFQHKFNTYKNKIMPRIGREISNEFELH